MLDVHVPRIFPRCKKYQMRVHGAVDWRAYTADAPQSILYVEPVIEKAQTGSV